MKIDSYFVKKKEKSVYHCHEKQKNIILQI